MQEADRCHSFATPAAGLHDVQDNVVCHCDVVVRQCNTAHFIQLGKGRTQMESSCVFR